MCFLYELLPEEYRRHRRAARRERLLSWRALVDAALARLDEPTPEANAQAAKNDFWAHRRAARREEMLACRSLFDGCLLGFVGMFDRQPPAEPVTRIEIV